MTLLIIKRVTLVLYNSQLYKSQKKKKLINIKKLYKVYYNNK